MAKPERPTHFIQKVLDNPWLLLVVGILVPTISYTLWGLMELQNLKPAVLP